jgi:hypothetical protein
MILGGDAERMTIISAHNSTTDVLHRVASAPPLT